MNKRQRAKRIDPFQKAFDVIAERLAATVSDISFFIDPNYDHHGQDRFQLHHCGAPIVVSKRVVFTEWRQKNNIPLPTSNAQLNRRRK